MDPELTPRPTGPAPMRAAAPGSAPDEATRDLLALTLTPGLGPVLIGRLIEALGSPGAVLRASPAALQRVKGVGASRARALDEARGSLDALVREELARAEELGVGLVARGSPGYPPLLEQIPDAPCLLYVRGRLEPESRDRFPVAIIGSRRCSAYGTDQAVRFAGALAGAGLTVVSGGARGIDTSAHQGALRSGGRTIAVMGCGLGHVYPPENAELFERIAEGRGAVVSELPMEAPPLAENFPARNRIISGLSLGVLVIEAGAGSGALITARMAAESHGREVMALPGRVDSASSRGSLELLKSGGAGLVTEPGDIVEALRSPAGHLARGSHRDRYPAREWGNTSNARPPAPASRGAEPAAASPEGWSSGSERLGVSDTQRAILEALEEPRDIDEVARATGLDPAILRAELTGLELSRLVRRSEGKLVRFGSG